MTAPSPPRLFLVDGYALIYRAFFALVGRPLTTSHGENTSIAWGVVSFLRRLLSTYQPEYLAWVHDSGLSFRHERFPAYKATREKLSEELQADFDRGMERISEILAAFRIPIVSLAGYQADDVIGTLAEQGLEAGLNVVIVSGDKDFMQLVRPGVSILVPARGGPGGNSERWIDTTNASERLGVPPERVTDYLALVGDSSDNVPGVRGIGEKTARSLVGEYGSLEQILSHAGDVTQKRSREALLASADIARLSKELVTIRTDLPLSGNVGDLISVTPDTNRLREVYLELEFQSLARDLAPEESIPAQSAPRENHYEVIDTVEGVYSVVARVRKVGSMSINVETVIDPGAPVLADPLRCRLISIAIGVEPGEGYYLPFRHRSGAQDPEQLIIGISSDASAAPSGEDHELKSNLSETASAQHTANLPALMHDSMHPLRELLADERIGKTGQNLKDDLLVLRSEGVTMRGLTFDTMVASYVLDPGRRSHDLDVLAGEFLDSRMTSYEDLCGRGKTAIPFDQCAVAAARDYSCQDADMALQLHRVFEPQLQQQVLVELMSTIEMPLMMVLADMEWAGVTIDIEWFRRLSADFSSQRREFERQIYAIAGGEFNVNSTPQVREVLFERLQLPVKKRTSTGPSTDASVLQELAAEGHEFPAVLLKYRELAKLQSTYLDALPALINPRTGRIHTSFNQTVAATGRLSSSEPNLQNIPIRSELGRAIRRGFVARNGRTLLSADYSQIELRLLAHLSADPLFVEAFLAGGDIHRQTASIIFGVPLSMVTPEMRSRAKTINFATIYGQGAHALSLQLGIPHEEAKDFIKTYFERFRGVRTFLDTTVKAGKENGYVKTMFGRRRYIPELQDRNFNIRAFGERTAANSPIQGSAADLIKVAMIRVHSRFQAERLKSEMILQVHDELVFEVEPTELETVKDIVRNEMQSAVQLNVPLVVDIGIGQNWLDAKAG